MTAMERMAAHHGTDKWEHGYCPHYERHFAELRGEPVNLLEIGVYHGGSLRLWADYFYHPAGSIQGVDIDPACADLVFDDERVRVTLGDVKDFEPDRPYDIIIDDGSHLGTDVVAACDRLWPYIMPGGWYVIEDLAVQWHPVWLGDPVKGSVASDRLHDTIDLLLQELGEVSEVHIYPQIVFLRKA
jgi:trans-aconitate methyltransferase